MLGHGLAEFLTHRKARDEFGNESLIAGGFDPVRLELKAFDDADISIQTPAQTREKCSAIIRRGAAGTETLNLLIDTGDVLDDRGLIGRETTANDRFFMGVSVDQSLACLTCVDIGDFDFFQHGMMRWGDYLSEGR